MNQPTQSRFPSIFNDVIGPVMRGPSSSHCAAAVRIGNLARDLMDGRIEQVELTFDPHGSLAQTHESQGSDMGLFGGLLGWTAADERLANSARAIREAGIEVTLTIEEFPAPHPNTYWMVLSNAGERHEMIAVSTGGGMVEILSIDGFDLSIGGDTYETLIFLTEGGQEVCDTLATQIETDEILLWERPGAQLIEIKGPAFPAEEVLSALRARPTVQEIKTLAPVLPVLSRREMAIPFNTAAGMLAFEGGQGLSLDKLAIHYESARGNLPAGEVVDRMEAIVETVQTAIQAGIQGPEYEDRILGHQSGTFQDRMEGGHLLDAGMLNRMILSVTALMEMKSAMGVVVAAPTAGACGALPGALAGAAGAMGSSTEAIARAMLAAGMIGVFIATHATFAAEVGGCQAECGSGSGMAAAGLVTLAGGSARQAVDAASMALQNILGMVCDPVANRVEVPCLGKNVLAAANGLACANMALAGYDPVIPLDEVIEAMDAVGKSIAPELRCTALGGLSVTNTSKDIERRLREGNRRRFEPQGPDAPGSV